MTTGFDDEPQFFKNKALALDLAKSRKAQVIYSIGPGEDGPLTATEWGYWVEEAGSLVRNWEKVVYKP